MATPTMSGATQPSITRFDGRDRGRTRLSWLDSRHTFSFGAWRDPQRMGVANLRVLNDDVVTGGGGFGRHPHANMEIITWVLDGNLAHEDSTGGRVTLRAGDAQHMSAGRGVEHSEFNASDVDPVHFLQIWLQPSTRNTPPRHAELRLPPASRAGRFASIATPDGDDGSLAINADARVFVADVGLGDRIEQPLPSGRQAFVHVATGRVTVNGHALAAGDALAIRESDRLIVETEDAAQLLYFDLPADD